MARYFLARRGLGRSGAGSVQAPEIELGPYDRKLLPRAQWGLVVDAQPWTIVSNVAAAGAMTAYLALGTGQPEALWWLLAVVLTATGRMLALLQWGRTIVLGRSPWPARATLLAGLAASGGLWGAAAALFIPDGDIAVEATFFAFAAGLCAAAAASLNAAPGASAAFVMPFLAALMIRLAVDGGPNAITLAIGVGAFAVCIYGVSRSCGRQTKRTLRLMLANRRLKRNLDQARTEKQSAEADALQSEQGRRLAETAASEKGRFLSIVGHELKTPLHGVIGFADMIRRQTSGPVGQADYVEYAAEIGRCGAGLLRLIEKILLFSRTSGDAKDLQSVPVDLEDLALRARRDLLGRVVPPGRRIEIDAPLVGVAADGDPRLLREAVGELIENADKFSPADAPIVIECDGTTAGAARLRVRDRGSGVPAEKAAALMQPFAQADGSYARQAEGLGIGLALVRHIVDLHGGEIGLAANPGGGTVVELTLRAAAGPPAAAGLPAAAAPAAEAAPALGRAASGG